MRVCLPSSAASASARVPGLGLQREPGSCPFGKGEIVVQTQADHFGSQLVVAVGPYTGHSQRESVSFLAPSPGSRLIGPIFPPIPRPSAFSARASGAGC